jgi:antitoxin FitA
MASIVIRQLPDFVKAKLKERAARHGRSMEEEARDILHCAVSVQEPRPGHSWADRIHQRFAKLGGFELPERIQEPIREPPNFE